jgi:hypothetical protein
MVPFAVIGHDIMRWPTAMAGSAWRQDNPTVSMDPASSYEATLNASDILSIGGLSIRLLTSALPISNPRNVLPSSVFFGYYYPSVLLSSPRLYNEFGAIATADSSRRRANSPGSISLFDHLLLVANVASSGESSQPRGCRFVLNRAAAVDGPSLSGSEGSLSSVYT